MEYLSLVTDQNDIIPVSATLAQETLAFRGASPATPDVPEEKASRWFALRPKAGRVFVSGVAAETILVRVEIRRKGADGGAFPVLRADGTLIALAFWTVFPVFRVVASSVTANTWTYAVAVMM